MLDFLFTVFIHALFMASGAWLGISYYRQKWIRETADVMQEIAQNHANSTARVMKDAYAAGLKDGRK